MDTLVRQTQTKRWHAIDADEMEPKIGQIRAQNTHENN